MKFAEKWQQFCNGFLVVAERLAVVANEMEWPCDRCKQRYKIKDSVLKSHSGQYSTKHTYIHYYCPGCLAIIKQEEKLIESNLKIKREFGRVLTHNDRACEHGASGTLTLTEWLQTLEAFEWKCAYCLTGPYEALDHVIPIHLKGETSAVNCVPSCKSCNSKKGKRHPSDLIKESSLSPSAHIRIGIIMDDLHTKPKIETTEA